MPYGGGALDGINEEGSRELEEFKKIIIAEPPGTAIVDLKEGKITVFDWWRNEVEYTFLVLETDLLVNSFNGIG
jgi:hypothetical protein